ncbi:uncharacterized protein BDR25DRAFT_210265 [Lindgomyces ingoldianus]|uniref:Uncharacterized protein n=1 Tax=Lindgomyces ingoldianus TaxID=673940 RepID=A0ACB6RCC8_9PLEO|nr:uncharacterized protein BDR25DRAFT_210265 [Lindgomyces ingoldianus]KAF2476172.1 hypothetical protein BDR25DRAFT_210265 [Lindgomyces ingoldianus]
MYTKHKSLCYMPYSNNRELITLIKAVSASRESIAPIVIIKALSIIKRWCIELLDNYLISTSNTAYSND